MPGPPPLDPNFDVLDSLQTQAGITMLVINDSFTSSNNPHILINENECDCAMPKPQALGMNGLWGSADVYACHRNLQALHLPLW